MDKKMHLPNGEGKGMLSQQRIYTTGFFRMSVKEETLLLWSDSMLSGLVPKQPQEQAECELAPRPSSPMEKCSQTS